MYERDGHACQARVIGSGVCSAEELPNLLTVHHIVPRSRGGLHAPANLITACVRHHRLIHADETTAEKLGLIDLSTPITSLARIAMARRAMNLSESDCRLYGLPYHVPNARKLRYRLVLDGAITLPPPGPPLPPPVSTAATEAAKLIDRRPEPPDVEWTDPETGIVYALGPRGARPVGVVRASDAATA